MNLMQEIMAGMKKDRARGTDRTITGCGCAGMPPELQETTASGAKAQRSKNLMSEIMQGMKNR